MLEIPLPNSDSNQEFLPGNVLFFIHLRCWFLSSVISTGFLCKSILFLVNPAVMVHLF